jgi:thiol-disulfide isomerase/thioredoxin
MEYIFRYRIVIAALVLLSVGGLYWFFFVRQTTEESMRHVYDVPLQDATGQEVFINQFTKRSDTVVFMWATWCPYCSQELKNLSALKARYGDDVAVVAVNRAESRAEIDAFLKGLTGVEGIVYLSDPNDALYKGMGGYAMPETFFVAKRGDVVHHQRGPLNLDDASKWLSELLAH